MNIIFYAGSLRPGGGLTVAKIMIEAMAEDPSNNIVVYTGAKDSSQALKSVFNAHKNIQEVNFLHNVNSELRYLLSKLYFLPKSLLNRKTLLISVNYFIPSFYKQFVYHLNLLSFIAQENNSFSNKIKQFDAKLACKYATFNVFESDYLKNTAEQFTGITIRNPKRLYIGVDPEFFKNKAQSSYSHNAKILLVSSPQPHKDNETCIKALAKLVESNSKVPWLLNIAGGQTKNQWKPLIEFSKTMGVNDNIHILGPLEKADLSKLMNKSLCLISASRIESFCMVALEAMASHCPAIVTDETSMPESVGDAAIIVEAGAPDQFAKAILNLYINQEIRNKLIHKGKIRANSFTFDFLKKELLKIIHT